MFQVVARRSVQHDAFTVALASLGRYFYLHLSVEVLSRNGVRLQHFLRRALEHNFAATPSGLGTYVYDVVGVEHHVLVVFNHDDRVAQVAQLFKRFDKTVIVALVKADARLVEYVEHVDKLRAYLRGKAYSLAFAARKRCRLAVEREVVEADFKHEIDACDNFLYYLVGYTALPLR